MPVFKAAPSRDLTSAISRAVQSANGMADDGTANEFQAEVSAAQTAAHIAQARKAIAEATQVEASNRDRNDPVLADRFAARLSNMNDADGRRMGGSLRGEMEQPQAADIDDAAAAGTEAQPFAMPGPNVSEVAKRAFQAASGAVLASRIGAAHSNAENLTKAAGEAQGNLIAQRAQELIESGDLDKASAINQAAKPGQQIKVYDNMANTGAVFAPGSGKVNSNPDGNPLLQNTLAQGRAKTANQNAQAALHNAQTVNAKAGVGKPPSGYAWGPKNETGDQTLVRIPGGPADNSVKLDDDAKEQAASRYLLDGTLPSNLGRGNQGSANTISILNRAAAIAKDRGQDGEATRITQLANKASAGALTQLSKQETMVGAFEKNFNKNADLALAQSAKVDRTGVPVLNRWVLAGKKNIAGDPDVAVLDTAIKATVNEYTKLISGSMGNAAMAEGEIKKVEGLLSSASTPAQVTAVLNFMKKETSNRMTSFADQKAELTKGMRGGPAAAPAAPVAKPGAGSPPFKRADGWTLHSDAKGNKAYVSPDGKQFEEVP